VKNDDDSAVYTVPEVGRLLKTPTPSIYAALRSGELPGIVRMGRKVLVSKAALNAWLAGETTTPNPRTTAPE
jgi:excisionase family DNA binding protein